MGITVKLIAQINASAKPLACDCLDMRGRHPKDAPGKCLQVRNDVLCIVCGARGRGRLWSDANVS